MSSLQLFEAYISHFMSIQVIKRNIEFKQENIQISKKWAWSDNWTQFTEKLKKAAKWRTDIARLWHFSAYPMYQTAR